MTNVATLPGITNYALCMPDGHFDYGFPIGGVAAMDVDQGGGISPGGIGFDINCEMRLVVTNLTYAEEAGEAYKNIDDVIEATELAGLCKRVVRLIPIGNIKG